MGTWKEGMVDDGHDSQRLRAMVERRRNDVQVNRER